MDAAWVMVGIAAAGVLGQLFIGQRNQGARDEKIAAHEQRLNSHSSAIKGLDRDIAKHGERIASVEARSQIVHNGGD
jgi:hypothetical protein